jgi:ectoine hydroxylase-related dioxygenase (phytanoyl-CoA dioxygenase family)
MLDRQQKQSFAENGYLVLPQIVPRDWIEAARHEIQDRLRHEPPAEEHRGPYFYFLNGTLPAPLMVLLVGSPALGAAESLIAPGKFEALDQIQISLNIPPYDHRPGGPHIDGLTPPEPTGRPGTFTLLAGVFLTDQTAVDTGNLWVWPGSHRLTAAYLREHGPDTLLASVPYPPVALPEARPVTGRAGDLLLAHYLLGHNMGGNMSTTTREVVYFRLRREGHRERWRDIVQDPLLEFEPIRGAVEGVGPS